MKSAAVKCGLPPPASSPLSHIPLPRRKSACKGEKNAVDADSELGIDCNRSQVKTSLLGSTSFCCASKQEEDQDLPFLRSAQKRKPPLKKEAPETTSPLLSQGRVFFSRGKRDKLTAENGEGIQKVADDELSKPTAQASKPKPESSPFMGRLRSPNVKKKNISSSPQMRSNRETPVLSRKDQSEDKKSAIKPRNTSLSDNPDSIPKDKSKIQILTTKPVNSLKFPTILCDENGSACDNNDKLWLESSTKCDFNVLKGSVLGVNVPDTRQVIPMDSCDRRTGDDLDCPCCDRTALVGSDHNTDLSGNVEIKMFTSCDVIPCKSTQLTCGTSNQSCDKEKALQIEIETLKDDLQDGKQKLHDQQTRVEQLEEELTIMRQLKEELDKEKELRKIAEDKLLELLDQERRMEFQRKESSKRMESKATQMDWSGSIKSVSCATSPLLSGHEGRLRKYQSYITKLESDNVMLINELKKLKDLSPKSQEEHAKDLVDKLGQMERSNQKQQLQYETCLDEVANKLVQTLLVQKRLEEECKVLHLRVEQLEHENSSLSKLLDKNEKVEVVNNNKDTVPVVSPTFESKRIPSRQPHPTSPKKKTPTSPKSCYAHLDKKKISPKSSNIAPTKNLCYEIKSPVTSPVSSASKSWSSKIPSFGSTKPLTPRNKSEKETFISNLKETSLQNSSSKQSVISQTKSKLPNSSKNLKTSCVKRKRPPRNGSPNDKDSKHRIKSNPPSWEPRKEFLNDLNTTRTVEPDNSFLPVRIHTPSQQIWSFNCNVQENQAIPDLPYKVNHSLDILDSGKLDLTADIPDKFCDKFSSSISETSITVDGPNRTRDEGYSTMSSDLQQDSTADTIISEPEHSSTIIVSEKSFASDDSVTECLDSSMCSSSDSGFGPLNQVTLTKCLSGISEEVNTGKEFKKLLKLEKYRKNGTIKNKEQIASVKPTIRIVPLNNQHSVNDTIIDSQANPPIDSVSISEATHTLADFSSNTKSVDSSPKNAKSKKERHSFSHSTLADYVNFPFEHSYKTGWTFNSNNSMSEEIIFYTKHNYIDDNLFEDKIRTAEKSTLTEPEEELWREKALAPFIDESIWSLYSSEGDIQIKHFPLEPLLSEQSLEKLITSCTPCIVVSENIVDILEGDSTVISKPSSNADVKPTSNASVTVLNESVHGHASKYRPGIERVASDTVLYLKDAIHELENSMRKGLKSSKNIPALHQNSGSESEASPDGGLVLKPEILLSLEATMSQRNNLTWSSPCHSCSTSSLQSSASYHLISDETEDVDGIRVSRKGSQDPDLSSDAEWENPDHKDFVESWLQKETNSNPIFKSMVSPLESNEKAQDIFHHREDEKNPIPSDVKPCLRTLFKSHSPDPISASINDKEDISEETSRSETITSVLADPDDNDSNLDLEATEFNGDFYTICSIGSLKSLDRTSPAKTIDPKELQVDTTISNRNCHSLTASGPLPYKYEKSKPTGLVKPTRPFTLPVSNSEFPSPHKHRELCGYQKSNSVKRNDVSKVPVPNSYKFCHLERGNVVGFDSPAQTSTPNRNLQQISLPSSTSESKGQSLGVKAKSPTKILWKCSRSPSKNEESVRKLQWKRTRQKRLKEGCGTAWIHLQPNSELSDPTVRFSLMESLRIPTSSSGSSTEDEEEEVFIIQTNSHLHRICRERRNRVKASANNPLFDQRKRSSIMGRREIFYRFGDKEQEAIACFDFLEEIPSSSSETLTKRTMTANGETEPVLNIPPSDLSLTDYRTSSTKDRISFLSPIGSDTSKKTATSDPSSKIADCAKSPFSSYSARRLRLSDLWNQPLSHNMSSSTFSSQDYELLDHISLSDSCAESFSSTPESFDDAS